MKYLYLFIIVAFSFSHQIAAQKADPLKCENLITENYDKVTGDSNVSSAKKILISKDKKKGVLVTFIIPRGGANPGSLIMLINVVGSGYCIDEFKKINILFRNGSRLEFDNRGNYNCDGLSTVYFGGDFRKLDEYQQLAKKEIETMRVWTNNGYVEEDFSNDNSKRFLKTLECLENSVYPK